MLDTMGKQWDKVPQELDRAGIQAQAQRASTNPERSPLGLPSFWTDSQCL